MHCEETAEYAVDTFPVSASKQRYFFGIKVHMLVDAKKEAFIEIVFTPGSENDMRVFKRFSLDIPENSKIYGDRAYNNDDFEDFLSEHAEIDLIAQRRRHSKRPLLAELKYLQARMRKRIETALSQI